jgi:hypothetical protein
MHPSAAALERPTRSRVVALAVTAALLAASLAAVLAPPARANVAAYEHSIAGCAFLQITGGVPSDIAVTDLVLDVPPDGVSYVNAWTGDPETTAGFVSGSLWFYFERQVAGMPEAGRVGFDNPTATRTVPGVNSPANAGLEGRTIAISYWAVSGIDPNLPDNNQPGAGRVGDPDDPLCTVTLNFLAGGAGGGTESVPPSVGCSPAPAAGATVTCTVTGGQPGIDILWRASYSPVFAEGGVTPGADGTGTFSFVVPAAARGQEVMVELVEWTAPAPIGVVGGGVLVPTSVPAGEGRGGPAGPLAVAVGLALVAGMVVRRRAVDLVG